MYYNKDTETCLPCAQGFYQSEAGQLQCIQCPVIAGRPGVTVALGARSAADCKGNFRYFLVRSVLKMLVNIEGEPYFQDTGR